MAKPLQRGHVVPPQQVFMPTPDFMIHHFEKVRPLVSGGALNYAYTTFGAQPHSIVGAATGMARQGLRPITVPLVSVPTVVQQGSGYEPGTLSVTPTRRDAAGDVVPQDIL